MYRFKSPRSVALCSALITSLLVVGAPVGAMETGPVPPPAVPVKITSCVVARDESASDATGRPANTAGVTIVVVNDTAKTIKDMQLSGVYNGLTVTDTFAGPFTAGQTYTLHKEHVPLAYEGPNATCVLNHVTYADGTDWKMAAPPVSSR